jgi:hypothetical protein
MRAEKPLFQRKRERTFVGEELLSLSVGHLLMVNIPLIDDFDLIDYFLRTTTQPIE